VDDIDLLTSLGSCAVLVRGNWYLQSHLLLWDPPMALARNFILFLLHTVGHVQRRGLEVVFEPIIGSEWIQTILYQVAFVRPGTQGYWSPRLADNVEFCLTFPETMQLHNQYWERQGKKFEAKLAIYQANIQT
jgi:RPC5 protein